MSKNNKLFAKLQKLEGAVNLDYDPFLHVIKTPSPGVNWCFANKGFGLPQGYSMVLWGPPKSGKSVLCNAFTGRVHRDFPEAYTVGFNTELRGELQQSDASLKLFGIDPERHITFDVNEPNLIFDRIENEICGLVDEGLDIKMIVIDSMKNILGRRQQNATTVDQQQIGNQAATIQDGLARILAPLRRRKISLIMTTHARAELDRVENMRGKDKKMAAAFALKHYAEYFCYVEPNESKKGRTDLAGEEFTNPEVKDFMDKASKTGHKIRFRVDGNSIGPAGRTAEFTLSYTKGIVNQYEEIFTLAKQYNVIERPNNVTYKYGEQQWRGVKAMLEALRDDPALAEEVLSQVYQKDLQHLGG